MSIELGKLLVMKYYNNVYSFTLKKRSFFFLEIFSIQEAKLCLKKKEERYKFDFTLERT